MLAVKLENFEGPLDLLLHLIEKNKVNIYDIPIAVITDQYIAYVNGMEKKNLDEVSEFLLMASTLLDIKARMLLPVQKNEEGEAIDPREELAARLAEYKLYKQLAKELEEAKTQAEQICFRAPSVPKEVAAYEEPVDIDKLLNGITLKRLQDVFWMVMKRQVDKIDPIRSQFGTIAKEPVRLSDKLKEIVVYAQRYRKFTFRSLLEKQTSKIEIVVTFLACLELIKVGNLSVMQRDTFSEIDFMWNDIGEDVMLQNDSEY